MLSVAGSMCVRGKSLTQLSFTKVVIGFSTLQARQKKTGKEYLCICCRHMGRGGELLCPSILLSDMLFSISRKVDPIRVLMLHCSAFLTSLYEMGSLFFPSF